MSRPVPRGRSPSETDCTRSGSTGAGHLQCNLGDPSPQGLGRGHAVFVLQHAALGAAPDGRAETRAGPAVTDDDHLLAEQGHLHRLDGDFLPAVARAADRQHARDFVAQGMIILVQDDAAVEKGFAQRAHVAEVDRRADDDPPDPRVPEFGDERGKIILLAFGQRNPGCNVAVDLEPGQFDQLGLNPVTDLLGGLEADPERCSRRFALSRTSRDPEDLDLAIPSRRAVGCTDDGRGGRPRSHGIPDKVTPSHTLHCVLLFTSIAPVGVFWSGRHPANFYCPSEYIWLPWI